MRHRDLPSHRLGLLWPGEDAQELAGADLVANVRFGEFPGVLPPIEHLDHALDVYKRQAISSGIPVVISHAATMSDCGLWCFFPSLSVGHPQGPAQHLSLIHISARSE